MNYRAIILLLAVLLTQMAIAQSTKRKKSKNRHNTEQQPTTLDPYFPKVNYEPRSSKKSSRGITYDAEKRYYEQLDVVAKEKRKAEKEAMKPQNSDPTYFGHKHPPKRHKPSKMKFCKICGIKH